MTKLLQNPLTFILCGLFLFYSCSKDEKPEQFKLSITSNPTEGGSVSPSEGTYDSGKEVTLTATASEGFQFKNWSGGISENSNTVTVEITANVSVTANFEKLDSDGDGLTDDVDQCADTATGQTVDAQGCSTAQKDTDGDGVTDERDNCSDTPSGVTVGEDGCEESANNDVDGDGVPNNSDSCSDTPTGEIVDENGCSDDQRGEDSDGDGVTDNLDECPDTPSEETVNVAGCSDSQQDADKDGVPDVSDTCAATPEGDSVDTDGCSDSQKDSDGDGITDDLDLCPETTSGESVDTDGCSDTEKDSDGDGVNDGLDQCPETPVDEGVDEEGCPLVARTYVPDNLFEQLLIDLGYDDVLDDYVLTESINTITDLHLSVGTGTEEIDITGLQDFVGLTSLDLWVSLGTFNLSNHPLLKSLGIAYGEVENILAFSHPNIEEITVFSARINNMTLDNCAKLPGPSNIDNASYGNVVLSNMPLLTGVGGIDTTFDYIRIENCPQFRGIGYNYLDITDLEIINCDGLEALGLDLSRWPGNSVENITLRGNDNLIAITVIRYRLQSLNISENNSITNLHLELNELTDLDLSANTNLVNLSIEDENLSCVKVNQDQLNLFEGSTTISDTIELSLDCN